MEVEIKKIPRHVIHPLVIINNSEFGSFKRQSVMVNAVQLFTGFRKATKMQFTCWVPKSCFFSNICRSQKSKFEMRKETRTVSHLPHIFSVLINGNEILIVRVIFRGARLNIASLLRRQIVVVVTAICGRWFLRVIITINIY